MSPKSAGIGKSVLPVRRAKLVCINPPSVFLLASKTRAVKGRSRHVLLCQGDMLTSLRLVGYFQNCTPQGWSNSHKNAHDCLLLLPLVAFKKPSAVSLARLLP